MAKLQNELLVHLWTQHLKAAKKKRWHKCKITFKQNKWQWQTCHWIVQSLQLIELVRCNKETAKYKLKVLDVEVASTLRSIQHKTSLLRLHHFIDRCYDFCHISTTLLNSPMTTLFAGEHRTVRTHRYNVARMFDMNQLGWEQGL